MRQYHQFGRERQVRGRVNLRPCGSPYIQDNGAAASSRSSAGAPPAAHGGAAPFPAVVRQQASGRRMTISHERQYAEAEEWPASQPVVEEDEEEDGVNPALDKSDDGAGDRWRRDPG